MARIARFELAMSKIDAAHSEDPNVITVESVPMPYELHYAQKMTSYLESRLPDASETLQLAIRAQHFRRWEVPRDSYPMTRPGYHSWRTFLKKRQAEQAAVICKDCGYTPEEIERISSLIRKEDLKTDEETQALEDVACLVFLSDQFEDFAKNHDEEKLIRILQKTWAKMSPKGHEMVQALNLEGRPKELVETALKG